jgi:hypothetical protein
MAGMVWGMEVWDVEDERHENQRSVGAERVDRTETQDFFDY